MDTLVRLAGIAQLSLCLIAAFIPKILDLPADVARLRPVTRHLFWTYAAYIMAINLAMGLVSSIRPDLLTDRAPLAGLLAGFIAFYWTMRMLVQFFCFTRDAAGTQVRYYRLADLGLKLLFMSLTGVYLLTTWHDWTRPVL
jgi:hypothetical protein